MWWTIVRVEKGRSRVLIRIKEIWEIKFDQLEKIIVKKTVVCEIEILETADSDME